MEFNHDFNDYYQVKDPINIVLMMQITRKKKLLFSRFLNFGPNLLSIFKRNELCLEDLKEKKRQALIILVVLKNCFHKTKR